MAGEARIVGAVKPRRTACGAEHRIGFQRIGDRFPDAEPLCPAHPAILHDVVRDVDVFQHRHIGLTGCFGQQGLDVFAVDLHIPGTAGGIAAVRIFQKYQTELFQCFGGFIQTLCHGQQQVAPDDAFGVLPGVVYIVLRGVAGVDVGVDGVDPGGKASAAGKTGLFCDQNRKTAAAQGVGGIATCRSAADDEHIGAECFVL